MPCRSETPEETIYMQRNDIKKLREDHDKVTRMLCTLCSVLEERYRTVWNNVVSYELRDWWTAHQEVDKKRRAAEAFAKHQTDVKKRALAKLSDEELAALGLKRS